jgi:hypothetical protein
MDGFGLASMLYFYSTGTSRLQKLGQHGDVVRGMFGSGTSRGRNDE